MAEPDCVAVVLAAGGSTRLGRPKQLLTRDGEPLLHRAVRLARAAGAIETRVVLGAARESMLAALRDVAQAPDVRCIDHPRWATGLAGSLQAAFATPLPHATAALVLGCDQPALELAHLRQLRRIAATAPARSAVTAYGDAIGIPVLLDASQLACVATLEGDRGLRGVFATLPGDAVARLRNDALGFDLDTPTDLQLARERGWIDAG